MTIFLLCLFNMEFSCIRDDLLFGVKTVSRALGIRSNMPILAGIKLETKGNLLKLYATDLERAIQASIPIENHGGDEAVVINGDIFSKITGMLPDEPVKMHTLGDKVELVCGGATFDLLTLPLEDYPEIPPIPSNKLCTLEKEKLQRGLDKTTFAALSPRETSRLSLTGVDMVFSKNSLKLVATNGYRLALVEEAFAEPISVEGEYLVSADSLKDLGQILSQLHDEQVEIYQQDSNLFFKADGVVFTARLIAEEYPDFDKVIPRENKIGLVLDRRAFLEALQRAAVTAAEESGAVILKAEQNKLSISSSSAEKGEAEEVLNLIKPTEAITISFKAEYLIDALKRMDSSEVTFWLADAESAGLLEPSGEAEPSGFIYVCMPIRME